MLTYFLSKPFRTYRRDPEKRNSAPDASQPKPEISLGDEEGVAEAAQEFKVRHLPRGGNSAGPPHQFDLGGRRQQPLTFCVL
jgi:hypothetical protein